MSQRLNKEVKIRKMLISPVLILGTLSRIRKLASLLDARYIFLMLSLTSKRHHMVKRRTRGYRFDNNSGINSNTLTLGTIRPTN